MPCLIILQKAMHASVWLAFAICSALGDACEEIEWVISSAEQAAGYWKKWNELPGTTLFQEVRYFNDKPIPDLPRRMDGVSFRFAAMAIISLIVRREMSRRIVEVVPKTKDFGDIASDFHYWNFTDAGLVEMLQTGRRPRRWREILNFATKRFRNDQIEANFESYAAIILNSHKEKWDAALEAFHKSEELYAKRPIHSGDKTYFAPWESSSPRAPASMDLRLAALLKYCFRKNRKLLASIDSVHKW